MIVRWLGAFGRGPSFEAALRHELARPATEEVCAEPVGKHPGGALIGHPKVGLIVARRALVRLWHGDVWSIPDQNNPGRLRRTRRPTTHYMGHMLHAEAWVHPVYVGIVVRGQVSAETWATVQAVASERRWNIIKIR